MNVLHVISDLPQIPAVYAMYGGKGRGRYVAYVGIAQKLRDRIVQHLRHTVEPSLYPALA
jgi:excinuclease UvrABC nuclease subunit